MEVQKTIGVHQFTYTLGSDTQEAVAQLSQIKDAMALSYMALVSTDGLCADSDRAGWLYSLWLEADAEQHTLLRNMAG